MDSIENKGIFVDSKDISAVVEKITQLCSPRLIYLYNQRINVRHEISSFKLCVVAPIADKLACERGIFREADCDIPFDILIYTPEEWERLSLKSGSFAKRISESGVALYDG